MRVSRVSLRTLVVAVAVIVAGLQLAAVTLAALPPNRYSDAASPHTGYLRPYFNQDWRLFAPDPVSEDRNILFQGSYRAADGSLARTSWVDWTDVELDLIRRRVIGGRAGYITNKLFSPLGQQFGGLSVEQRTVAAGANRQAPQTWVALRASVLSADGDLGPALSYLRYERAVTRLGSAVLTARWPERDITGVRYAMRKRDVVPYDSRSGTDAQREASRPSAIQRVSGWRTAYTGGPVERRAVADFDRRHR